jgi:hypothetical protein
MLMNKFIQTLVGTDVSALAGFHDIPINLLNAMSHTTIPRANSMNIRV